VGIGLALLTFLSIFLLDDYWLYGKGTVEVALRRALFSMIMFTGWIFIAALRKR
jgi:hypothetical protein